MALAKHGKLEKAIQAVEDVADVYQEYFLDYVNNFLTVEGYASYYGITKDEAESRIRIGGKIHEKRTGE